MTEKMQELRRLTEENWEKGECEMASLGERVLKTVQSSKAAMEDLKANANGLRASTGSLIDEFGRLRRKLSEDD